MRFWRRTTDYSDEDRSPFGRINADHRQRLEFWRILCESFSRLKPREFVARKPDSLPDKSEVLGQTLKTANKIDADFTLLIRDESVLRSEVSVRILIAYRRHRHDEVSERHAWNEGVKPS